MLIIAGHILTDPSSVEELACDLRALIPRTLKEDGCLGYAFALDDAEKGSILVYERWRDETSLAAHLSQPSIAELMGKWAGKIEIAARKFDAANERDPVA